jgi:hypothetical protein
MSQGPTNTSSRITALHGDQDMSGTARFHLVPDPGKSQCIQEN